MAELNQFVLSLEKELTCSICQDILNQPKTLQCLHSFCQKCIAEWNEKCRTRRKRLTCPTCITPVEVQDDDISKLQFSFHLDSLKQLLFAMRNKASEQDKLDLPNCVSCDKHVTLVAFCPQCEGMVCADCKNAHNTMKQFRDKHQVTLFGELKQEHVNTYISNQQRCAEKFHEKEKLQYYCQTCMKAICQICSNTDHSSHQKISIDMKAEEIKRLIHQDLDRVNQQKQRFLQELDLSKQNIRRLENETNRAKKEVDDHVQAQIKILQDRENAMTRTLDEMYQKQKTANDEEQRDISTAIQQLDALNNQGTALQHQNVPHFILENQFPERCQEMLQNSRSVLKSKPNNRNTTVRYIPTTPVTQPLQDIGKIAESVTDPSRCCVTELLSNAVHSSDGSVRKCEIVTRNSAGELCYTNQGSIDVQIKHADGSEVENELTESGTGMFIVTYKAEKPSPYQILVSIGTKAIKDSPKTLHGRKIDFKGMIIFGENGDGKTKLNYPRVLALGDNGEVVIADNSNHRIVIFNADGNYIRQFGGQGTRDGQLYFPWGVVMYKNTVLVSDNPDSQRGRIQEFDVNGAYLRTIYRQERVILRGMCVNDQHIAVCCEHHDDTTLTESGIKLLSKESGHVVQEIPTAGKTPRYIAYSNHRYFVSYRNQDHIDVYDENGALLYKFGDKEKGDGQFDVVRGLAVYGGHMLLVCDYNNHRVQVFTQEGQFLTSFGSYGSGKGQMNRPFDVVVTPDGKVLVVEHGGARVQVWQ